MHSIRSNKNIVSWKMTWFLSMKKGCLGASPSFDACTSCIFLGVTWASPSLSFCPYFISSHHFPFPTLENFLHTKLYTILISNVSASKIVNPPFWFSFNSSITPIKEYTTVATTSKVSWSKELKKKEIKRQTRIVAEICQNRTAGKDLFFENFQLPKLKSAKLMKVRK
jgi:hypothetical protein